jgi:hypothetical protein
MLLSKLNNKWLMRLFAALSTLYGFWFIFNMDLYLPVYIRFKKGVFWTVLGHFALWLATLEIRGRIRYLVATVLFLSLSGLFFLWDTFPTVFTFVALAYAGWILFQLVRGNQGVNNR